jgi:type III pantothenate kinase
MNLVIDQGNTVVKFAVFSGSKLIKRYIEKDLKLEILRRIFREFPSIERSILSSVASYDEDIHGFLISSSHFINLDSLTPIPIINNYSTKDTLGYDRIASAIGAHTILPFNNVLVIDAGTAITIDLITSEGVFIGGNISPGLDLRFMALNQFTKKLPLVKKQEEFELLGTSTHDAILSGVLNAVIFELDGYISELKIKYPDLKTVLTGGDMNYFVEKLKNIIFVDSNLNLSGLNRILEYNAK